MVVQHIKHSKDKVNWNDL